jgi:hypothetical protein
MKHGILAKQVVLPDEDPDAYEALRAGFWAELEPAGELEELQVDLVVAYAWRLRRVMRIEKGIFVHQVYGERVREMLFGGLKPTSLLETADRRRDVAHREAVIDDPAAREAARAREELKDLLGSSDAELGAAFMKDALNPNVMSKLARYEAHLQRSLVRALEELRKLQAIRLERQDVEPRSASLELEPTRKDPNS